MTHLLTQLYHIPEVDPDIGTKFVWERIVFKSAITSGDSYPKRVPKHNIMGDTSGLMLCVSTNRTIANELTKLA